MKRFFTYILALFLPVYLLVSLVWGNSVARNRPCKGLCVTVVDSAQAQYVSADEIRTYLEKYVPTDKKTILAEINTEEMEALLSENRLVDSAAYFLDEHGEMMPAGLPEAVSVPVATGHISSAYAREALYPFACFLRENAFWQAQVEQIYVDDRQNVELIPRVGDHRILLGELTAYEEKLDNLRCLYEQALSECGWNKYHTINLKYKDQVVCTRRK